MGNDAHLKSIVAIPKLINNAIFIEEYSNEKASDKFDTYKYYVCGLKVGDVDYTVKMTIGVKQGKKYYDHALTEIEKGKLLDQINDQAVRMGFTTVGDAPLQPYASSIGKDSKLLSILKTNASKIVDENGEPMVVYHQTSSTIYKNVETGELWNDLDWQEKQEWEEREDFDDYWQEGDFYTFDNSNHGRRSIEMPAYFFSTTYDEYHEYGDRTIEAFLNIRNPKINPQIKDAGATNTAGEDAMNKLIEQRYDDFIREEDGEIYEINAFNSNQIKSTTENSGEFNEENDDIRYRYEELEKVNQRFNEELDKQIKGELPKGHVYQIGMPNDILLDAGIPQLPIELVASRLSDKSMQETHPFDLNEMVDLPYAIQKPLAIFRSATHIGSNVILTSLKHGKRNYVVAIETNKRAGKNYVNKYS